MLRSKLGQSQATAHDADERDYAGSYATGKHVRDFRHEDSEDGPRRALRAPEEYKISNCAVDRSANGIYKLTSEQRGEAHQFVLRRSNAVYELVQVELGIWEIVCTPNGRQGPGPGRSPSKPRVIPQFGHPNLEDDTGRRLVAKTPHNSTYGAMATRSEDKADFDTAMEPNFQVTPFSTGDFVVRHDDLVQQVAGIAACESWMRRKTSAEQELATAKEAKPKNYEAIALAGRKLASIMVEEENLALAPTAHDLLGEQRLDLLADLETYCEDLEDAENYDELAEVGKMHTTISRLNFNLNLHMGSGAQTSVAVGKHDSCGQEGKEDDTFADFEGSLDEGGKDPIFVRQDTGGKFASAAAAAAKTDAYARGTKHAQEKGAF